MWRRIQVLVASLGVLLFTAETHAEKAMFWWGISTSAYQTEDVGAKPGEPGFFKTDWDLFYDAGKIPEPRGDGTFSFSQVDRDIRALKELGITHYRFGVEWARLEPRPGVYNPAAFEHYGTLIRKLRRQGITPILCLWHFTFPDWGTDLANFKTSGWLHPEVQKRWPEFVKKVTSEYRASVDLYSPQNEPNAQALAGYFVGAFPPGVKYELNAYKQQVDAAARAYIEAAGIIREEVPGAKILTIQNIVAWERVWWDVFGYFWRLGDDYNYRHLDRVAEHSDLIGFNYYYKRKASPFENPSLDYPEGLEAAIAALANRYRKPIVVVENGVPDPGDVRRQAYLKTHVAAMEKAKASGYDVRGYFYWSLIDNFEWAHGYKEKFGLYSLGPNNELLPKRSAFLFQALIRASTGAGKTVDGSEGTRPQ